MAKIVKENERGHRKARVVIEEVGKALEEYRAEPKDRVVTLEHVHEAEK